MAGKGNVPEPITSAVILAAGLGGRLRSVHHDGPKSLLTIMGESLLEHLKLPTEALPLARARSPAFEGA